MGIWFTPWKGSVSGAIDHIISGWSFWVCQVMPVVHGGALNLHFFLNVSMGWLKLLAKRSPIVFNPLNTDTSKRCQLNIFIKKCPLKKGHPFRCPSLLMSEIHLFKGSNESFAMSFVGVFLVIFFIVHYWHPFCDVTLDICWMLTVGVKVTSLRG